MTLPGRTVALVLAALAAVVVAFLWGRQSAPVKVKTETKVETRVEYRDRVVEVKAKDKKRQTTTRTETKPDGSSVTLKVEQVDTHTDLGTVATFTGTGASTSTSKAETATGSKPGWRLSAGAEWGSLQQRPDAFRLGIDRRLVGPIWLGVEGSTDKRAGLRVGVEW